MTEKVVTLVPYRPNGGPVGDRYRWLWDQVRPSLEALGHPVFVGEPNGEQWSRSEACNNAAALAGAWDVAVITDCDTIPDEASLRRSLRWVLDAGGAVRPHMERLMLTQAGTMEFLQRGPADLKKVHFERSHAGGGILVVTREAFDEVGGYDETFKGWGYEDSCMNLRLLAGPGWERLPGTAWHLWHPRDDNQPLPASRQRYRELVKNHRREINRWGRDKGLVRPAAVF